MLVRENVWPSQTVILERLDVVEDVKACATEGSPLQNHDGWACVQRYQNTLPIDFIHSLRSLQLRMDSFVAQNLGLPPVQPKEIGERTPQII
jgi:hypothetical protein